MRSMVTLVNQDYIVEGMKKRGTLPSDREIEMKSRWGSIEWNLSINKTGGSATIVPIIMCEFVTLEFSYFDDEGKEKKVDLILNIKDFKFFNDGKVPLNEKFTLEYIDLKNGLLY